MGPTEDAILPCEFLDLISGDLHGAHHSSSTFGRLFFALSQHACKEYVSNALLVISPYNNSSRWTKLLSTEQTSSSLISSGLGPTHQEIQGATNGYWVSSIQLRTYLSNLNINTYVEFLHYLDICVVPLSDVGSQTH